MSLTRFTLQFSTRPSSGEKAIMIIRDLSFACTVNYIVTFQHSFQRIDNSHCSNGISTFPFRWYCVLCRPNFRVPLVSWECLWVPGSLGLMQWDNYVTVSERGHWSKISSKQLPTHVFMNKYAGLKDDTGPQSQWCGLATEQQSHPKADVTPEEHCTNEVGFVINNGN